MVGVVLSVTLQVPRHILFPYTTLFRSSVTVVRPRPTRVPAVGVCVIESGVELLQSVASTPLVKSGTGAWQRPLAKSLLFPYTTLFRSGVLSVTVKEAVQVDSLVAPSLT